MADEFRRRADEDVRGALADFAAKQADHGEALARIEERLRVINGDVGSLKAEVGGAPEIAARGQRESLRWRVHELEGDKASTKAAHAALEAAREIRAQAWSHWQKRALFAFASLAAISSLLRLIGLGG